MVLLYKILSMTSTCVGIKKIIEKKWTQKIYLMNLFLASPMDQCKYVILSLYCYNSFFLLKNNMKFRKVNKKLIKGEFWLIKPETFFLTDIFVQDQTIFCLTLSKFIDVFHISRRHRIVCDA